MKKIQWVAVSVCFVLAVTLWFLVTLNKQSYTTAFDVPVKLMNFPSNYQLLEDFPSEMRIYATGPGIKLLYQDFDPLGDTVKIDFDDFKGIGFFPTSNNLQIITKSLKPGLTAVGAEPDTIRLRYAEKTSKRVPVKLDLEWDLPASYRIPPQGLSYTDTVSVIGPPDSLKFLSEVKTVHYKLPYRIDAQDIYIPLDSIGALEMLPNQVHLQYTPQPYTEKAMRLPVRVIGVPAGVKVHFDPDTIVVKLLLPLEDFEKVQSGRLSAEVSWQDIDPRSTMVVPRIMHIPAKVEVVDFTPKLLRYLIITQE